MSWKRTVWSWKSGFAVISVTLTFGVSGCSAVPPEETEIQEEEIVAQDIEDDVDEMADLCLDIYQKAAAENKLADLETVRSIVNRFGEYGYPAVDSENQVDMTMAEQIVLFCDAVEQKEMAETAIFQIDYFGGFVKYGLQTKDGNVEVTRSYYTYENGTIQRKTVESYQAEHWTYTEEGYLMFSGTYFSEELYALTLSAAEEHVALRVEPLDEQYRELNRKYLQPIGYERNNLFITDWNESDFGDLDFYDLFDLFYSEVYENYFPYTPDDNLRVGAVYRIPKEDFERVIQRHFIIDSSTLQSKTVYHQEDSTYEYRPRGFEEVEYPEYPYSEVTGFTENSDGTITLMVRVVFPYHGDSNVYAHEVTVRHLDNGGVQYVSNKIIPSEDNGEITWHTPRLTEEEWEELYSEERDVYEKGYNLPVDEEAGKQAEEESKEVMEMVEAIYRNADKGTASNVVLSDETILQMKETIRETGQPVTSPEPYAVMENYKKMEDFLYACRNGEKGSAVIYELNYNGGVGRKEYIFDGTDMYLLAASGADTGIRSI